jgi:YidC/Oxa1 family membrane protein insertase
VIAIGVFQSLLDGMGWILAKVYEVVPNWGLSIIVLTVLIRLVLLPLGIKQIRSMQNMQIIQPKIKQIQEKYKGNKQRQQEEMMNLYREHGVNPFSGCWPVLLQFPILIAMYSVVRFPQYPVHIPAESALYSAITAQIPEPATGVPSVEFLRSRGGTLEAKTSDTCSSTGSSCWVVPEKPPGPTSFLGANLLCSAQQAGTASAKVTSRYKATDGNAIVYQLDCGSSVPERLPYYAFAVLMFGTTYYQQRQMQRASPPGAASSQQQALLRFMPLLFGVWGFLFPAGLVLYWTTSNAWQIGQQYFMLRNRPSAEELAAKANGRKRRGGFMTSMMQRADQERKRREAGDGRQTPGRSGGTTGKPGSSGGKGGSQGKSGGPPQRRPGGNGRGPRGTGGSGAGSRKKRPKR